MKTLSVSEVVQVFGGKQSFVGGGGKGRWGSYGRITGKYTFNLTKNISISPSITVTKLPMKKPKVTGGGIGINIRY
ncbi:hypothetical protein NYR60_01260 [Actinobacillus genomosp. 2]|uniref:hypothetical protein n=1 Tax=Actinobacillus genomosp. 2 TaxID=230709 RepID=UPI0024434165|nr:hypothetical protein [Actinobacillus genomosp. 2]WGE32274.1 hypothetical protein NYR60_01260 [Actinobacillus genomosp. 2]